VGERGVAAGELRAVLPRYRNETPLHLLTPGGRHLPRRVTLLRDHLVTTLTAACKGHGALA
ncbi:MAG: LysR family transcriptional regulator, partial [Deltaproteobacteria bacterium]|nr:LysR family transcriptional regulator [Deltaproteobacteria bacterium]